MWFTSTRSVKFRPRTRSFALACRPRKSWRSSSDLDWDLRKKKRDAGRFASLSRRFLFGRLYRFTWGRTDWLPNSALGQTYKSPEVMLILFVSASSSRLDPRRPALVASLRVATRDLGSGSGLTANRINQSNASGLYLASNARSCSPRPALCYR